jgi:hypothetical protein
MIVKLSLHKIEILFWTILIKVLNNRRALQWIPAVAIVLLIAGIFGFVQLFSHMPYVRPVSLEVPPPAPRETLPQVEPLPQATEHLPVEGRQTNLLVILVDSLSKPSPELKGVWLVGRAPSVPQVVLLPLYPTSRKDETELFSRLFHLDSGAQPAEEFLEFLKLKNIWWDHYLVADETSLAELIALTEGVHYEGHDLSGREAIASLLDEERAPQEVLRAQAQLAGELCRTAPELLQNVEPVILWGLLTHRMHSDFELSAIESAHETVSQPGGSPVCEFPTLEEMTFRIDAD